MTLLPGMEREHRSRELSQFYTPSDIAERMWRWMLVEGSPARLRALEPSAGQGALIKAAVAVGVPILSLTAFDIDRSNCESLLRLQPPFETYEVLDMDFLATGVRNDRRFDIAVINPPYENGMDVAFASKCLDCCTRVCGIFRAQIFFSHVRQEFWSMTDVRRGAYLVKRPHFGGEHGAKTDFVALDLTRRKTPRKPGGPMTVNWEWWT
jgi:predicted RNA methylase